MKIKHIVSRLRARVSMVKKLSVRQEITDYTISKKYDHVRLDILSVDRSAKTNTAIIIHLYYTDVWREVSSRIKSISAFPFDIFVSLPEQNSDFKQNILNTFPKAFVYESPNKGRDVLPFISIAQALYDKGYKHVLKLHSKKSIHRTDGEDWMNKILDALIPTDSTLQYSIMRTLDNPRTGLIGPKGQYVSLKVNFEANGSHMTNVIKKIYSKHKAQDILQINRSEYGFFAGTMFWVNLESIKNLIGRGSIVRQFEAESGQIDATFAHALERLFCLVPEIEGNIIYEVDAKSLSRISYNAGTIPDWSGVYIGPKRKK